MIGYDSRVIWQYKYIKISIYTGKALHPTSSYAFFPDIKYLNAPPYLQQEHTVSRHQAEARSPTIPPIVAPHPTTAILFILQREKPHFREEKHSFP